MKCLFRHQDFPANTGHSLNAVSMLGQRRRRWANIETVLSECPVFSGLQMLEVVDRGSQTQPHVLENLNY